MSSLPAWPSLGPALLVLLAPLAGAPMRAAWLAAPEDPVQALRVGLRSGNKWSRVRSVDGLAALALGGRPELWEHVLDALSDRAGEVADTAQVVLASARGPEVLEGLAGRAGLRSRDEWVRLRAAEALGRLAVPVPARGLVRALSDDDARVRRMALWSLERLARAGNLEDGARERTVSALVRSADRDRDVGNRARALCALAALGATGDERCAALAGEHVRLWAVSPRERDQGLRSAAAALAPGVLGAEAAVALLAPLARDPSRAARLSAQEALAGLRRRDALLPLIESLSLEPEERLTGRLVESLRRLSGLRHRRDPRPWMDWFARLPDGSLSVPLVSGAGDEGAGDAGDRSVALAGLPIVSSRVCFLIDLSGSMWSAGAEGRTRKEVVAERLGQVLERLPASTSFNLIPFTGRPLPWSERLVPATSKNVRAAVRYFERLSEQGTGNFWDAADLALEDPEVDTLVVLTDGVPTGGRRHRLDLIVPLYLERDLTRRVSVDSILVGATERYQAWWRLLAHGTAGRSVAVEL